MLYFQSIIVYTLLALLMCYGAQRSQDTTKQARLWGWLPIILFTLVFGLRYGVGVDYNNYIDTYEDTALYNSYFELLDNERHEEGFLLLIYLCHLCGAPIYIFFSIIAFIQIVLIYHAFKDEGNILAYIYLTLILTGFCVFFFMNILRHEIAFCIFMCAVKYIRDNKLLKYWICCLLALAFHHSALLLFPLYFIWIRRKGILNKPTWELIAVCACFFTSFITSWQEIMHLFDNLIVLIGYESYINIADDMEVNTKIGITRLFNLLVNCIIIANSKKIKEYFKSDLLNIIYDLYVVGVCLGYVFFGSMMLGRIIVYFAHTQFIILAYALCYLYQTRKQNTLQTVRYAIIVLFITISYGSFIYNCKNNTGAYVFYFQTNLHNVKDNLRAEALSK